MHSNSRDLRLWREAFTMQDAMGDTDSRLPRRPLQTAKGLIRNSGFTSSHGAAAVSKNQETARQKYLLAAAGRDGLKTEGA